MKKIIIMLLMVNLNLMPVMAVEFDTSIDANIRKNYNVSSDKEVLPALPSVVPTDTTNVINEKPQYNPTGKIYVIKGGTKIILNSQRAISDRINKGSKISFVSQNGFETKDKTIIPAGTLFKGTITDAHPPQLSGNGGLIELKIDEIYFNGIASKIETKLSSANSKKVFFSNIKGKRSYWHNFAKTTQPGRKFFGTTQTAASAMAAIPIVNIFSFIPLLGGAAFYTVNIVTAPIITIFTKGGNLSLPAGTSFIIKVSSDTEIKG